MIVPAMTKKEVNREIIRVLPSLMKKVFAKKAHRDRVARKKGYPDHMSRYEVEKNNFIVYYFGYKCEDLTTIFCPYYDDKGIVYAYVSVYRPDRIGIVHFLKHALDQYTTRLNLGLSKPEDILFHMAKFGLAMVRKDNDTLDEHWLDVGWKNETGLWLGQTERYVTHLPTHVSIIKTFINDNLVRHEQEAVLNDKILQELIAFGNDIGGDEYARDRVKQLIGLFRDMP